MRLKLPTSEQWLFALNILANKLFFKQEYSSKIESILVVRWDEIGDMATSLHVFDCLKESYPNARLTVLCKPFVKQLLINQNSIDEVITEIGKFDKSYDAVVELRGTWKTLFKSLIYRVKYRCGRAEVRWKNKGAQLHEIETNAKAIEPILKGKICSLKPKIYVSEQDKNSVKSFLQSKSIGKFVLIHPAARRVLRQWPPEYFAQVIDYLESNKEVSCILAGTDSDRPVFEAIENALGRNVIQFTGKLSEFGALCYESALYIGNESGPLHIASAAGVPLIGLYGPGVPDIFYPGNKNSIVLHKILECNPCDQIHCKYPENPCITRISVQEVVLAINTIVW